MQKGKERLKLKIITRHKKKWVSAGKINYDCKVDVSAILITALMC